MYPVIATHATSTSTAHSSAVSRTFSRRLPGTANVSNETAKVPGPKVWLVMSKKGKKSAAHNVTLERVKREMEKPRKSRSAKMAELSLDNAHKPVPP
jgi:hypothetical protein